MDTCSASELSTLLATTAKITYPFAYCYNSSTQNYKLSNDSDDVES